MASGLAHEINNPLTIILGKLAQIRRTLEASSIPEKEEIFQKLKTIENSGDRIVKIIKGLKTYTRDDTVDLYSEVSFRTILENALDLCRTRITDSSVDFRISPISEKLFLECRPSQITQVILNLLNNAFDEASNSSEKWIGLEVVETTHIIRFSVTDSGKGISKENQEKLFQPFFTTKPPGKGTGLGLTVVKGIVEDHSGTIEYNPNFSNTCFVVTLPKKQKQ